MILVTTYEKHKVLLTHAKGFMTKNNLFACLILREQESNSNLHASCSPMF